MDPFRGLVGFLPQNGGMAVWRNGGMAEWRNGGMVIEWWNGGMVIELRNGGMRKDGQIAGMATYVLFTVDTHQRRRR